MCSSFFFHAEYLSYVTLPTQILTPADSPQMRKGFDLGLGVVAINWIGGFRFPAYQDPEEEQRMRVVFFCGRDHVQCDYPSFVARCTKSFHSRLNGHLIPRAPGSSPWQLSGTRRCSWLAQAVEQALISTINIFPSLNMGSLTVMSHTNGVIAQFEIQTSCNSFSLAYCFDSIIRARVFYFISYPRFQQSFSPKSVNAVKRCVFSKPTLYFFLFKASFFLHFDQLKVLTHQFPRSLVSPLGSRRGRAHTAFCYFFLQYFSAA